MWELDPHRKQQRISSASLFFQCSFLCLTWSFTSSDESILSCDCSSIFSESLLCLGLRQQQNKKKSIKEKKRYFNQNHLRSIYQFRHVCCDCTHFLRMGQSFMKWPILPQIRQQRSLGATSPSVRISGSKKYSWTKQIRDVDMLKVKIFKKYTTCVLSMVVICCGVRGVMALGF